MEKQIHSWRLVLYALIALLVIGNIALLAINTFNKKVIIDLKRENEFRIGEGTHLASLFSLNLNPFRFPNNLAVIDECRIEILLTDIIKNQSILYLVSKNDCRTCFKTDLDHLKKLAERIGSENIFIIGDELSSRELSSIKKSYNLDFTLLSLKTNANFSFELGEFKKNNKPLFLMVDDDLNLNGAFYSDYAYPNITDYLIENLNCCNN